MSLALDQEFRRPLPFPAGHSPFHIKGLMYFGLTRYAENKVPGGLPAVRESLDDPSLRDFLDQPFVASAWYDVFPIMPLTATIARLTGTSVEEMLRRRTRRQAEKDLSGVYRFILKLTSSQTLAKNLPRVTSQVFDFGDVAIHDVEKKRVFVSRTGLPQALAGWYGVIGSSYIGRAMELGGVRNPRVVPQTPIAEGTRDGVSLVALPFELTWD